MNPNQQLTPQQSASFQSTIGNIQNNINTYASSQNKQLVQNPGGSYSTSSTQNIPGSSYINNTPINTTPDASTVASANPTPIYVPPQSSQQVSNSASSAINNVNVLNGNYGQNLTNNQGALLNTTDSNTQKNQQSYNDQAGYVQSLITQYAGMGQDQLNQEQQAGVPKLQTQSNQLTQQYLASQATYNSQYNDILNNPNLTREQASQQIDSLQQQHGFNLTDIGIRQSIAQNDYNNAETLIQHQIQIKYGALANQISYQQQFLQNNKDLLTQSEQQSFQANLQVQQQMYTQGTYYSQLNAQTSMDILKTATGNGAPQNIVDNISKLIASGASAGDIASAAGQYAANGSFTPVQTGIDLNTGLPIYSGFNSKTGQLEVKNPGNILGGTGSASTVVSADGTGYQMGATTTLGAYASATTTQVNNINTTVAKINANVGQVSDATTAQQAINTINPNSSITGQMIMTAANKYGVSPTMLIGTMQAETQLGTDKSKGSQMNNFGNVHNTDSAMAAGQPTGYKSAQDGVNAVAQNLAKRQVQPNQNDPAQPASDTGTLTPQQIAQQTIGNAPTLLQPAMGYTLSTGSTYIDSTKVPSNLQTIMQSYAATRNIPVLNADQVSIVKGADEAARNIINVVAPTWNQIAPDGTVGKFELQTYSILGGLADTDKNATIKTFQSNRENLAQQIRALSQSAPKGSLLSTAEAALPSLSGYGFHFGAGTLDSKKVGNVKMQKTLDLLSQTINTYLPGSANIQLPSYDTQQSQPQSFTLPNKMVVTLQADGTYK